MSKSMNLMRITLFFTLNLAISLATTNGCTEGCLTCAADHCISCFRRPFINHSQCSSTPAPTDNCDLYTFLGANSPCLWCSKGFALDESKTCVKSEFQGDCQIARKSGDAFSCFACIGGFPSADYSQCVSFVERDNGPSKNCSWGATNNKGENYCLRCDEGFMVVGGGCVKQTLDGCLEATIKGDQCNLCDGWNGWNALDDTWRCVKVSEGFKLEGY